MKTQLATPFLTVTLSCESDVWQVVANACVKEERILFFNYEFTAAAPSPVPYFKLSWTIPGIDVAGRWTPRCFQTRNIPPNWGGSIESELGIGAPVLSVFSQQAQNRQTVAFSDAMNPTRMRCGFDESNSNLECWLDAFSTTGAPVTSYKCTLRIDLRDIRYEDALKDVSLWWAGMPEYTPCPVPQNAREPVYSSWYGFHQDLFDDQLEAECKLATGYQMASIIVDDGWQTADNHRGYAFCGDWEMCEKRFPNIVQHVRNVHALGMKYVLWYSMPWVGLKSKNYPRFEGKYLYVNKGMGAAALDPRFPEVREFLINTYEKAMKEWDLDGFKLDFIDSFKFNGPDPAIAENYAGRDCKALTEGVDRLLVSTMKRLRAIKPDAMIEFRQNYIGPAMRKYGNMFRAADCPNDYLSNRIRTLDVRMLSDFSAVHSDMLMWHYQEPVVAAARQCWNILFSVPQLSLRLKDITPDQGAMLKFYIKFWKEHADVLLDGTLRAEHPELSYPQVTATKGLRSVTALYATGQVFTCCAKGGENAAIVNASGTDGVVVDLSLPPKSISIYDATGKPQTSTLPQAGLGRLAIPDSGVAILQF